MRIIKCIFTIFVVSITISCNQFGGKIIFDDDEWIKIRENAEKNNYADWDTILEEYNEKWTINGLRFNMGISAHHTVFSSEEPYYIKFDFYDLIRPSLRENYYIKFSIKDVKITGESGKDYQSIVETHFPVIQPFERYYTGTPGYYYTDSVFPFSFEKLVLLFTVEVEASDGIEAKTFHLHLSPRDNPPYPFWSLLGA